MRKEVISSLYFNVLTIFSIILCISIQGFALTGEIVKDGSVDWSDVNAISLNWLDSNCADPAWCSGADINRDANVTFIDFALLANNWLMTTTPPSPSKVEGYEPLATGGQGGTIVHVTSLADSGSGTLRAAVAALTGTPTIIVFDVSGVICTSGPIDITRPNVTIDGSTAPGNGITMTNSNGFFEILGVDVDGDANVIIKNLRFRGSGKEGIQLWEGGKITIDHCSVTGSADGALDMNTVNHVCINRCLIAGNVEGHKAHGTFVTAHYGFYSWNDRRQPRVYEGGPYWDFRNNVVEHWNGTGSNILLSDAVNLVNNWFGDPVAGMACDAGLWSINTSTNVYIHGNYSNCGQDIDGMSNKDTPNIEPNVTTVSAIEARAAVLAEVGAQPTDAIDQYYLDGGGTNPPSTASCGGSSSSGGIQPGTETYLSDDIKDGYTQESTENSGAGGSYNQNSTFLGDSASNQQYIAILHFNTSSIPDAATVTAAKLTFKRSSATGNPPSLGSITIDIKNGYYGTSDALKAEDFQSPSSAVNVATMTYPASNNALSTGDLNAAGREQINKTGVTQIKLRFTLDDNNDSSNDYLNIYDNSNNPSLEVTW